MGKRRRAGASRSTRRYRETDLPSDSDSGSSLGLGLSDSEPEQGAKPPRRAWRGCFLATFGSCSASPVSGSVCVAAAGGRSGWFWRLCSRLGRSPRGVPTEMCRGHLIPHTDPFRSGCGSAVGTHQVPHARKSSGFAAFYAQNSGLGKVHPVCSI
jgi:hypothetical protein